MVPMLVYRERHPVNLFLLGIFTLCCSLSTAVSASTTAGMNNSPWFLLVSILWSLFHS